MRCLLVAVWIGVMSVALWGRASEIRVVPSYGAGDRACACLGPEESLQCVCTTDCHEATITIRTRSKHGLMSAPLELDPVQRKTLAGLMARASCLYKETRGLDENPLDEQP